MVNIDLRDIRCESIDHIVKTLGSTNPIWRNAGFGQMAFRGQADTAWQLIPRAFRKDELLGYSECPVKAFVEGMEFPAFYADRRTNLASVRAMEIIGEAASHVPASMRRRYLQPASRNQSIVLKAWRLAGQGGWGTAVAPERRLSQGQVSPP